VTGDADLEILGAPSFGAVLLFSLSLLGLVYLVVTLEEDLIEN
jgi:hypothetical protein